MKAIFLDRRGPPEVLVERRLPTPQPQPDEIRIGVRASGINFADLLQRLGLYASAPRPPYIPGFEVAGEVEATGDSARRFRIGDRVTALTRLGGYAEKVCVAEGTVLRLAPEISFEEAAALPVNYLTAWFCIKTMGNLQPCERVLIHAGAGGVGTAAVQLASTIGAECFATVGSEEKVEFLRRLGVDHPINYRTHDFAAEIRRLTGGCGVDLILDAVGGDTMRKGYELLSPLGRLVSYGLSSAVAGPRRNLPRALWAWWRTPRFNPLEMIGRNVGVFGFHLAHLEGKQHLVAEAFAEIARMVATGTLKPIIARTFPLSSDGAAAAHRYLHERRNIGKVLLVPEDD
ncbi:MAG: zinc-binding dehydrogenase [Acidobacteriota bacterium]